MPPRKRKRMPPAVHIQASATVGQAEGSQVTGAVVNAPDAQRIHIGDTVAGDKVLGDLVLGDKNTYNIASPLTTPALHQLRAPVGDFVGREQEIAELVQAAQRGAAAAISGVRGMGGIGKTELAYVVAHQLVGDFPDAQIVVDLRGASDPLSPVQVLQSVIRFFEPEARPSDDLVELQSRYRSHLSGKRALILADDARDAAQVRPLLPPLGCALLVTSRYRFTLPGMLAIDLGTLAPAEAEVLLLTICPRIGEAAPALAKLCGYLPLALRVSAGLLASDATLSVKRYLERLADERHRLAALRDGDDPALDVEAVLALNYAALSPVAQTALCQLSVFIADFDLSAAQAVVMLEGGQLIDDLLSVLYRRSLLDYDTTQEHYSLHDLVRVFAHARLDAEASGPLALRYVGHYVQVADRAETLYRQGGESILIGLALFDRERAHIDAGWAWACGQRAGPASDELVIRFAGATVHIGDLRYAVRHQQIPHLESALAAAIRLDRRAAQSGLLGNLGNAYFALGATQQAIEYYEQQYTISHEIGYWRGEENALSNMGNTYAVVGDMRRAIESYERSLAMRREQGDRHGEGAMLCNLGNAYAALGDTRRAIELCEQSLVIARELGNRRSAGLSLLNLGNAYLALDDTRRAIELYEQHRTIAHEMNDRRNEGSALGRLGRAYARLGDTQYAIELCEQSLAIAHEVDDRRSEGEALDDLGMAYLASKDARRTIEVCEQSLAIARELGNRRGEGMALLNIGHAYIALGDVQYAINSYEQALLLLREVGDRNGEATLSWNLGVLLYQQGELARAVTLMQVCVDYEHSIDHPYAATDAMSVEELRQLLETTEPATQASVDDLPIPPTIVLQRAEAAVTHALAEGSAEERAALAEKLAVTADAYASGDTAERALAAQLRGLLERLMSGDAPDRGRTR